MMVDMASAATALVIFLLLWFTPVVTFMFTTRLSGFERFNWGLLIAVLTWPAFGLYLFYAGVRGRLS